MGKGLEGGVEACSQGSLGNLGNLAIGGKAVPEGFPETQSSLTFALAPMAVICGYAFPVFPKGRSVWPG